MENCFLWGERDDGRTLETAKSTALKLCLADGDGVDEGDGIIRDADGDDVVSRDFDSFELVFDGGFIIIAFNASCWSFAYIDGFINMLFAANVDFERGSGIVGYLALPPDIEDGIGLALYNAIKSCCALSNAAADCE